MNAEEKELAKRLYQHVPDLSQLLIDEQSKNIPRTGERNILITSALPYVNNVPHLGNIIGSTLSADVFARYCRLRGRNCLYICGTDEYGTATETKALEEGCTPKELCDKYFKLHSEVYDWFNIKFDNFGRTSTAKQTEICQDFFLKLQKNGYFNEKIIEQLFCEKCQLFLADRYVEGICPFCRYEDARGDQCDKCGKLVTPTELHQPKCKVCKLSPIKRESKHQFLDLPKLEPKLREWLDKTTGDPENSWTNTAKGIAYSWLKEGLKERGMTRDLTWGTPVPMEGYENKVFYVWFDAPIGYLSITANLTDDWEKWWKNPDEVECYQFMAKDNVPFHAIIFPSMQLGTGERYTMCRHLSGIDYLNYEDTKFSKSRNVGVFGNDAKSTDLPADIYRFYLLYVRPESQDSSFSWTDLQLKVNSELLNNLGNFVNRALSFLAKNFDGVLGGPELTDEDVELIAAINREVREYCELMDRVKLKDGIAKILNISRLGNGHVQATSVWTLLKTGEQKDKDRALTIMSLCANIAALISHLIAPYMPAVSQQLKDQLNFKQNVLKDEHFIQFLPAGHKIGTPYPLFKRIEQKQVDEYKKNFGGQKPEKKEKKKQNKKKNEAKAGDKIDAKPEQKATEVKAEQKTAEVKADEAKVAPEASAATS